MDRVIEYSSPRRRRGGVALPWRRAYFAVLVGPVLLATVWLELLVLDGGAFDNLEPNVRAGMFFTPLLAELACPFVCSIAAMVRIRRTKARGWELALVGLLITIGWALLPFVLAAFITPA